MQKEHYPDRIVTRFYQADDHAQMQAKLMAAERAALANGATHVSNHEIDPYAACPCGSGNKYKFCCRTKAR